MVTDMTKQRYIAYSEGKKLEFDMEDGKVYVEHNGETIQCPLDEAFKKYARLMDGRNAPPPSFSVRGVTTGDYRERSRAQRIADFGHYVPEAAIESLSWPVHMPVLGLDRTLLDIPPENVWFHEPILQERSITEAWLVSNMMPARHRFTPSITESENADKAFKEMAESLSFDFKGVNWDYLIDYPKSLRTSVRTVRAEKKGAQMPVPPVIMFDRTALAEFVDKMKG